MSRRTAIPFADLARLQALATLERRRELEQACAETDRLATAANRLADDLTGAEQGYAEIHADARMCLSRMTVAAAIVHASADALLEGQDALDRARAGEGEASAHWLRSRHRADWFGERDRDQRKDARDRRDDRAEMAARALALARGREA